MHKWVRFFVIGILLISAGCSGIDGATESSTGPDRSGTTVDQEPATSTTEQNSQTRAQTTTSTKTRSSTSTSSATTTATPAATRTSTPASTDTSSPTPTQTTTPTTTPTPPSTASTVSKLNLSNTTYRLDVSDLTANESATVNRTVRSFYRQLPENKSERLALTAEIARKSCQRGKIDASAFKSSSELKRQTYRLYHTADALDTHFNRNIDPEDLKTVIRGADRIGKYAPILGSYNRYINASCNFDRDRPETVQDYYIASASLGVEVAMVQSGVAYRVSSKVTRVASHSRAFRTVQTRFGDDALSILMSETHWAARQRLAGVNEFVVEQYDQYNLTRQGALNETRIRELSSRIPDTAQSVQNQTAEYVNSTLENTTIDERTQNVTEQVLNNTTVDEQITNATEETIENTSVNETVDVITNTSVTENKTLGELLSNSGAKKKIKCVSKQGGSLLSSLSAKISTIVADGRIEESEVEKLPEDTQVEIKDCLQPS